MKRLLFILTLFTLTFAAKAQQFVPSSGGSTIVITTTEELGFTDSFATYKEIRAAAIKRGYTLWKANVDPLSIGGATADVLGRDNEYAWIITDTPIVANTKTGKNFLYGAYITQGKTFGFLVPTDSLAGMSPSQQEKIQWDLGYEMGFYNKEDLTTYFPWKKKMYNVTDQTLFRKDARLIFRKI